MSSFKPSNKGIILGASSLGTLVLASIILVALHGHNQYSPTTVSNVPRSTPLKTCSADNDNPRLSIPSNDQRFIVASVVTSIVNIPASTSAAVHITSYSNSTASGTVNYGSKYGQYNFTADKTATNSSYTGDWRITRLEACHS